MADFRRTKVVNTKTPTVNVAAGLPAGKHRFQLIVTDRQGNQSRPAELVVEIRARPSPDRPVTPATPILEVRPITRVTPTTPLTPIRR
jgi:hypothetical protein